jgi:hypothetical protein
LGENRSEDHSANTTIMTTQKFTPWNRVLLEKLAVTQLFKKFSDFYETERIITIITEVSVFTISIKLKLFIHFSLLHVSAVNYRPSTGKEEGENSRTSRVNV